MKHTLQRLCALVIALVTAIAICPTPAQAAVNTPVTARYVTEGAYTTTIMKRATAVKKGRTTVTVPAKGGWIKFKAPKTKYYTFTFYRAKPASGKTYVVCGEFSRMTASSFNIAKFSTTEGTRKYLLFCDSASAKVLKNTRYNSCRYLASRPAKIKINKGKYVYISLSGINGNNKATKGSFYLYIK